MEAHRHPAHDLPEADRIDYLIAVGSIAFADGATDHAELIKLSEMCAALGVTGEGAQRVASSASVPDQSLVERILGRFRKSDLRVALLTDVVVITYADDRVSTGEAAEIARFAKALDITTAQAVLIARYVEDVVQGRPVEKLSRELAEKLSALAAKVPHHSVVRSLFDRFRKRGA